MRLMINKHHKMNKERVKTRFVDFRQPCNRWGWALFPFSSDCRDVVGLCMAQPSD